MFSNREIALAVWIVAFLAFALSRQTVRESFAGLIKVAFNWKIILPVTVLIAYVTAVVWGLKKIEVWTPSLLKDTVIWFLFSGLALAFSFVSSNLDKGILRRIITDNVKVIVILEFIIEEYTFSLPVEFTLIPFIAIVAASDVIAKTDQKLAAVAKLTTAVQVILGLFILTFAVARAVTDFHELASVDSIRRVLLIPILSISLAPYIYVLLILTNYELLFVRLKMNSEKEPGVARYAKWRLVNHLRMRPKRIRDFLRAHAVDLVHLRTKGDVDKLMEPATGHSSMPANPLDNQHEPNGG